jgi:hypothetical protein
VWDLETSRIRRPWPKLGHSVKAKNERYSDAVLKVIAK